MKHVAELWTEKRELAEENYKLTMENQLLRTARNVERDKNVGLERKCESLEREIADLKRENAGLRTEFGDMKAAGTERDWKDKARDAKLAELEVALSERRVPDEAATAAIGARDREAEGESSEKMKPTRRWHLPSDAAMGFGAALAGGAETLIDHTRYIPPEYAGIGATVIGITVAGMAWWRSRGNKENRDESHRPEG